MSTHEKRTFERGCTLRAIVLPTQRCCEEVYDNKEETAETQKERLMNVETDTSHRGRRTC